MNRAAAQTVPLSSQELERILENHHRDPNQLLGILLDVQAANLRHYIPRETALQVGKALGIKESQIYDTLTFYAAFHQAPRARCPIEVCGSAPCMVCGSGTLLSTLQGALGICLGETTADGLFGLEQVPCFGACDVSPAVRVNGKVYGHLDSEKSVEQLLSLLRQEVQG
ncbi:MAG: NAD(P)H-dependent oxidoreductase subunit E [Oscillospiraceae bacterium]